MLSLVEERIDEQDGKVLAFSTRRSLMSVLVRIHSQYWRSIAAAAAEGADSRNTLNNVVRNRTRLGKVLVIES